MVVRAVVQNGHGPVKLFHEDKPYHLVRERHFGKGNLFLGSLIDGRRESVRSADDEHQPLVYGMHFPLYPVGKLDGAEFFSMLVEQHYYIAGLQGFQDGFAFLLVFFSSGITSISNET